MAHTLTIASAIVACDALVDQLDSAAGTLEIRNSSETVLVTFTLNVPCFGGAVTDGGSPPKAVATANVSGLTATPSQNGTADHYVAKNNGGTEVWRGDCGTSGAEMILDTLTIDTGVDVTINSWLFKHKTEV